MVESLRKLLSSRYTTFYIEHRAMEVDPRVIKSTNEPLRVVFSSCARAKYLLRELHQSIHLNLDVPCALGVSAEPGKGTIRNGIDSNVDQSGVTK